MRTTVVEENKGVFEVAGFGRRVFDKTVDDVGKGRVDRMWCFREVSDEVVKERGGDGVHGDHLQVRLTDDLVVFFRQRVDDRATEHVVVLFEK